MVGADECEHLHRDSIQGAGKETDGRSMDRGVCRQVWTAGHKGRDALYGSGHGKGDVTHVDQAGVLHPDKDLLRKSIYSVSERSGYHAESLAVAVEKEWMDQRQGQACEECPYVGTVCGSDRGAYHGVDG